MPLSFSDCRRHRLFLGRSCGFGRQAGLALGQEGEHHLPLDPFIVSVALLLGAPNTIAYRLAAILHLDPFGIFVDHHIALGIGDVSLAHIAANGTY